MFVVPLPPPWAGVEQVSRVLLQSALTQRFDVRVIKSNVRDSNADKGRWDVAGIWRVFTIAVRLKWNLLFRRPDVVYLTLSQNHAGLARDLVYITLCRIFRVPVVAHLHGSLLPSYLAARPSWQRRCVQAGIRGAARIVTCGESMAAELRPTFGDRVVAVSNATPPDAFLPAERKNSRPTVAYMGHLSRAKGFYDVLSAAEIVLQRRPGTLFVFAGERLDVERNVGGAAGAADGWKRFEGLQSRFPNAFRWVGVVSGADKADFFAGADVFVLPSYAEAFPVSILEAMAARLPVIATPVGAVPEVVRPGENGALVKPGDVSALAAAVLALLENDGERHRQAATALETARAFSVDRQASAFETIFNDVASERA